MLNSASILFGLIALALVVPGLIPFLGLLNWLALPFAGLGAALGALSHSRIGRNFNFIILAVAVVRLTIGGGLL